MDRIREALRLNWPPFVIALGGVAVLLALAGRYGLHRDEMYFIVAGRHPDFGYVDQPPITPLLNAISAAVFGVSAAGVRIAPALAYGVVVLLTAAIARELGGGRRAQAIAALTIAVSGYIDAGHMNTTATYDVLGWTVFLLIVIRVMRGGDPRLWLAAGLAAGIALENKNLIVFLGAGLAAGIVISRRWELLRSRWIWAGGALALLVWAPDLIWQATHGWPQLEMARAIAARDGDKNRSELIVMQLLFSGPLLFPVMLVGLWSLLRSPATAALRPIGWSYLVVLVLLYVSQGKGYYAGGLLPTLMAAGAVVVDRWLDRGGAWVRRAKWASYAAATVGSAAVVAVMVLPVIPPADFPTSDVAKSNGDLDSQYGWESFVAQVRTVTDGLAPEERDRTAIVTANYGEAGALELLAGPGLPGVYSGHNSYADWGPPPESATTTVLVMNWDDAPAYWSQFVGPCRRVATIDLGFPDGVYEEQGAGIFVCRGRTTPWSEIWPHIRHFS